MKTPLKNAMKYCAIISCSFVVLTSTALAETMGAFSSYAYAGRSLIVSSQTGQKIRITPYGNNMVRIQAAAPEKPFLPDNHYEMIERHDWDGTVEINDKNTFLHITLKEKNNTDSIFVDLQKDTMRLSFGSNNTIFLREKNSTDWTNSLITQQFEYDSNEHFTGLGHDYYGRVDHLDLRGQELERNYQRDHEPQAPLIVPFYISSKGYGVFLNSTFRNKFRFGVNENYSFSIDTGNYAKDGQMDYVVINGPDIKDVLRNYISLTGHPRLPPKAMFGLALSDKGDPKTSDENWWKNKVTQHRNAGFSLDHMVNDNRWRAAGGERCNSKFDWDKNRYPNPRKFEEWATLEHLVLTLDFNRCIAPHTDGYDKTAFNIPNSEGMDFSDAAPDLTNTTVRHWWWNTMYTKGIKPLGNPSTVGLWIDEFDQMGPAPDNQILNNGRSFAEMRNYWFMLIGKGLAAEGWDKNIGEAKRPFIWVRGNTAGAQRYSTLWSGDIQPTYDEMKSQIRGMQAAGLSGFPFWGHDAGGFNASNVKDFDTLYRQWSLAMGSFSPFWKPHGIGPSRWPLDRSPEAQSDFLRYSQLRYQLMPYTYSYAYRAFETGEPIARPMLFNYPTVSEAWKRDLQYLWGDSLLIAPNTNDLSITNNKSSTANSVPVWLPPNSVWYDFWNDKKQQGGNEISYTAGIGQLPLFVAAGSIIPMSPVSLSITDTEQDVLEIHIYTGADGKFTLYEDDGISEKYKRGHYATQDFIYNDKFHSLQILPIKGSFKNVNMKRRYQVVFHGLTETEAMTINNRPINSYDKNSIASAAQHSGSMWSDDGNKKLLTIYIPTIKRSTTITLSNTSAR